MVHRRSIISLCWLVLGILPLHAAALSSLTRGRSTITERSVAEPRHVDVSFSHIQLYVDHVEDVSVYKELERNLNLFASSQNEPMDLTARQELYRSITGSASSTDQAFEPQNRDVVKQLVAGLGFRVTGARMPSPGVATNTRSVLVTSRDPAGVQMIVTSSSNHGEQPQDDYSHFDAANLHRFYGAHENRQGIAVLGFEVSSVNELYQRYMDKHPDLVLQKRDYKEAKVLEVFSYYKGDTSDSGVDNGTVLRFVEPIAKHSACILPGLMPVEATFDEACLAAYCDHWVSNVVSRTSFLNTLEDTLGFTPKVDFNAGVVAAGEAQIESTVTGNEGLFVSEDKVSVLKDQRQVYLPINNALSDVGHVHGFLNEIGQGVQHIASRVDNLIEFVQRGNDYRKITGEGFTFLQIPRSYYGILTKKDLTRPQGDTGALSEACADAVLEACSRRNIVADDYAVDLEIKAAEIEDLLDCSLSASHTAEYQSRRPHVLDRILRSRYTNLYSLLGDHLSEESYLGIVRNQILVDVQGEDLLFQIFTSNILQRSAGEEAPFFEFIQRVCSECKDENGCPAKLKPGCGGFGIRNFLTLFLSIEVSKAMTEASRAKSLGDKRRYAYAQQMVDCFTNQLNDANPILTEISDAMTEEGKCRDALKVALDKGDDKEAIAVLRTQMNDVSIAKNVGNEKLMKCSAKYKSIMKSIREGHTEEEEI